MKKMNFEHYKDAVTFSLPDRTWPDNKLNKAPQWCSIDLRDGNQSLEIPMTVAQKSFFLSI